jgi:hypothetical protein
MSTASENISRPARFFAYSNGNGFCKFVPINDYGAHLWVMGSKEKSWTLAGLTEIHWLADELAAGRIWEFSPAALLGGSPSLAKTLAARVNGSKGGRPRKSV